MKMHNGFTVTVYLKDEVEKDKKFNSYHETLGNIELEREDLNEDARFSFQQGINDRFPKIAINYIDEVSFFQRTLDKDLSLPYGIHKFKNCEVIITDPEPERWAIAKFFDPKYSLEIRAKDLQSFLDIYTKFFPENVEPEFAHEE